MRKGVEREELAVVLDTLPQSKTSGRRWQEISSSGTTA